MGNCASSKIHEYMEQKEDEFLDRLRSAGLMITMNKAEAKENARNKYLMDIDRNTVSFVMLARESASANNAKHPKSTECKVFVPKKDVKLVRFPGIPLDFLAHDEDSKDDAFASLNAIFGSMNELAMVEKTPIYFDRPEDVRVAINAGFGNDSLPFNTVHWHYWNSHNTIRNLAFSGIGSFYLTGVKGTPGSGNIPTDAFYQIDFARWHDYSVRCAKDIQSDEYALKMKDIHRLINQEKHTPTPVVDSVPSESNPELYHRYGAILYFTRDRQPLAIYWPERKKLVAVTDPDFSAACTVFRSTLICLATIENHLIRVHWSVANSGAVISSTKLSGTHPIRRLLKPHIYHTATVNYLSTTALAPVKGLAYRLTAFNAKGWSDMVVGALKAFKFESIEEHFQAANLPPECRENMPFYQDGLNMWEIIRTYVSNYVDIFYDSDAALTADSELVDFWNGYLHYFGVDNKDFSFPVGALTKINLIKLITHHIFWVTVGHEFIGDVNEYLQDPLGCPSKLYRNRFEADCQSFFQALTLISLTTGNPCKLVNDWTHLWKDAAFTADANKHQRIVNNLKEFQDALQNFAKVVEQRNVLRPQQFNAFNPIYASCSVAV